MTIKILIADDHALVRAGLKMLLSTEAGLDVVAETGNGSAVENLIADTRPDMLLLDLELPGLNGIEIAAKIRAKNDTLKIIMLTASLEQESVRKALSVGANGYVTKQEDSVELLVAIRAVSAGKQYVSKNIASAFELLQISNSSDLISPRERQILGLVADGHGNQDIANTLHISLLTVRTHRQNLMKKLGLHNAAEITAFAIKQGLYRI